MGAAVASTARRFLAPRWLWVMRSRSVSITVCAGIVTGKSSSIWANGEPAGGVYDGTATSRRENGTRFGTRHSLSGESPFGQFAVGFFY